MARSLIDEWNRRNPAPAAPQAPAADETIPYSPDDRPWSARESERLSAAAARRRAEDAELSSQGWTPAPSGTGLFRLPPPPPEDRFAPVAPTPPPPMDRLAAASRMFAPSPEDWRGYEERSARSADRFGIWQSGREADPDARRSYLLRQSGNRGIAPGERLDARDELVRMDSDTARALEHERGLERMDAMPPPPPPDPSKRFIRTDRGLYDAEAGAIVPGTETNFAPVGAGGLNLATGETTRQSAPPAPVVVGGALVDPSTGRAIYEGASGSGLDQIPARELWKMITDAELASGGNGAASPDLEALREVWRRRFGTEPAAAAPARRRYVPPSRRVAE